MPSPAEKWLQEKIEDERRQVKSAIRAIIDGVAQEDLGLLLSGFEGYRYLASYSGGWKGVLRSISNLPPVSDRFRAEFVDQWTYRGDTIRSAIFDDLALVGFLRLLLPPYAGPDRRLYRGDSAFNRRHRTYGVSWTDDLTVARAFAELNLRFYELGTVVLEADVSASAIVSAPVEHAADHGFGDEREYVVDRRGVRTVRVIERIGPEKPST